MKSIIFNQHQVNYALKNKEGMFRVVIKPKLFDRSEIEKDLVRFEDENFYRTRDLATKRSSCQVGETIFAKERLCNDGNQFYYDDEDGTILSKKDDKFWKRNCHKHIINARNCPQWASRITLRIKSVKVERLQDISEEDAVKEGIINSGGSMDEKGIVTLRSDIDGFRELWNSTHKKPEEKFEANPFVFCFSYEVVR